MRSDITIILLELKELHMYFKKAMWFDLPTELEDRVKNIEMQVKELDFLSACFYDDLYDLLKNWYLLRNEIEKIRKDAA